MPASVSSVAASTSTVTLFAATSSTYASGRAVYNDSAADLYLKFGDSASTTDFTVKIPAFGYWESSSPAYGGQITGVWSSATGNARCTHIF